MVNSHRLRRDRLTFFAYISTAGYVWGLYGLGPALLLLRDETGMSRTVSSLHSSGTAVGVFLVGIVGASITERLGRARTIGIGTLLSVSGLLLIGFGGKPAISIPGALIMGFGGSLLLNGVASFLSEHHGVGGPLAIGEQNGVGTLAGLLSPLALGALVGLGLNWRIALMISPLLFGLAAFIRRGAGSLDIGMHTRRASSGRLPASYWWAWGTMTFCIGVEFSFVMWAGDVLRNQSDASVSLAAASLTAVALGMTAARFLIGILLRRVALDSLFLASLLLPLVMWVPLWLSHNSTLMLLAMVTIGLGIGFHYPLGFSRLVRASGGLTDRAAARSSLASGLAIGLAPLGLGALADAVGLHTAFIAVPVMLALAITITVTKPVPSSALAG